MSYSERAYFPDANGNRDACHHCATRDDVARLERKRVEVLRIMDRRGIRR